MLQNLALASVLIICFLTDLKEQRIYNKVIYPALIAAVILNSISYGFNGFKLTVTGFAVGLAILLVPYFLGGIGAGDVKLLALIGAFKGSIFVMNTAIYMALIGGIIALIIILVHKQTVRFFKEFTIWIFSNLHGIRFKLETPMSPFLMRYPYGTAIAGGALVCLLFKGAWLI